jgi:hypothetical protein
MGGELGECRALSESVGYLPTPPNPARSIEASQFAPSISPSTINWKRVKFDDQDINDINELEVRQYAKTTG